MWISRQWWLNPVKTHHKNNIWVCRCKAMKRTWKMTRAWEQQGKNTTLQALESAVSTASERGCRAVSKRQAAGMEKAGPQHYQGWGIEVQCPSQRWGRKASGPEHGDPLQQCHLSPEPPRLLLSAETNLSIKTLSHRQMFSAQGCQCGMSSLRKSEWCKP